MAFVKLDCGMLNSTIWMDREAREVFITALLMAEPIGTDEPMQQLEVRTLKATGWVVPPGAYGFVPAAGVGIVRQAGIEPEAGLDALERLGSPESDSRNPAWEGRRLVRVDHGYIVLNYDDYRARDYTAAERQRRYREKSKFRKEKQNVERDENVTVTRDVTLPSRWVPVTSRMQRAESREQKQSEDQEIHAQSEALRVTAVTESEQEVFEAIATIKAKYPKAGREDWITAEKKARELVLSGAATWPQLELGVERMAAHCRKTNRIVMNPSRFFGDHDQPWSQAWSIPKDRAEARLEGNVDVMQQFVRGGAT